MIISANKLKTKAAEADKLGDEESAYLLSMRYFQIISVSFTCYVIF